MESILRRELKSWQKAFKAKHGRDPTKRDILADPKIAGTYDTWRAVGGDVQAKPKGRSSSASSSSKSAAASTSKKRLEEPSHTYQVFKTPSKKRSPKFTEATVPTSSPSRNPFRTPSKSSPNRGTPSKRRRHFATPSKRTEPPTDPEVSPARSLIEVEMTPTKRSPLVDHLAKHNSQYVASSPSKLRTALAASSRLTPTKRSPIRARESKETDAALNQALVAYTPRTKARKRLRGEDVPPTPHHKKDASGVARTDPRPATQKGLSAFGFASSRKVVNKRSVTAPASVFARAKSTGNAHSRPTGEDKDEDEGMLEESPIKAVAKLRRTASTKPGFKPLFASPSGNHVPQDVLGTGAVSSSIDRTTRAGCAEGGREADADAVMDDGSASPVGGLFASEVQQRRLRRARETGGSAAEGLEAKKHKARPAPNLPASSDDEGEAKVQDVYTSSPAYRTNVAIASSPQTELTVPSSAVRPSHAGQSKDHPETSSPSRSGTTQNRIAPIAGWRKVQQVELSDEDELPFPSAARRGLEERQDFKPRKKVISITPYQRYGTLRTTFSSPHVNVEEGGEDEEEGDFSPYSLLSSTRHAAPRLNAVDAAFASDSDSDDPHTSLAGLKLSPVRHAPSSKSNKVQRMRLLNSIFDPTAHTRASKVLNPEARFGPLQPSKSDISNEEDEEDELEAKAGKMNATGAGASDDDDDDWQQEVDEDFTFLDSEIELQDVA